jgi:hypothetical protein
MVFGPVANADSEASETGTATPPVTPWIEAAFDAEGPGLVIAVLAAIVARLPPVSSASADVLKFVPPFAVTVPEIVGVPPIVAVTLSEPEESDHVRPAVHVPLCVPMSLQDAILIAFSRL